MSKRAVNFADPTIRYWESNNLEDHVGLIAGMVSKSLADPETTRLANKLVRGIVDGGTAGAPTVRAWGMDLRSPGPIAARDDCCAVNLLWNFVVANVAYVPDPEDFDLFCTVKKTLEARQGDCDDSTIVFASLFKALGWREIYARIISTDNVRWCHIYPVISRNRDGSGGLIALDTTVKNAVPGWEYTKARKTIDFRF